MVETRKHAATARKTAPGCVRRSLGDTHTAIINNNTAPRGGVKLCKEKKVKMAVNRRPPFPLPEVSSAPSWFEFSSFLLTFAAEADMFFASWGVTYRRRRRIRLVADRARCLPEQESVDSA